MSPENHGVFQLLKRCLFDELWHLTVVESGAILAVRCHCSEVSFQRLPTVEAVLAGENISMLLRTMHEITSRFVAQLHRIFGCSSIAESST
jgi:hypothetical protein